MCTIPFWYNSDKVEFASCSENSGRSPASLTGALSSATMSSAFALMGVHFSKIFTRGSPPPTRQPSWALAVAAQRARRAAREFLVSPCEPTSLDRESEFATNYRPSRRMQPAGSASFRPTTRPHAGGGGDHLGHRRKNKSIPPTHDTRTKSTSAGFSVNGVVIPWRK